MPCERCGKQNPADVHTCTASREYMLEIIQKEISDKTLSFGCYILSKNNIKYQTLRVYPESIDGVIAIESTLGITIHSYEIIGHPVMLGDVLDWINVNIQKSFTEKKPVMYDGLDDYRQDILYKWIKARKPIEDQSDDCICYIYSLLPPEVRK